MGYDTSFTGSFKLNRPLDEETFTFLNKLNETRRMKRKVDAKYGVEGEFYVDGKGFMGQDDDDETVLDRNQPPRTQPGLWCQWRPNEDGTEIVWDEREKFYDYVEWLVYLVDKILKPRGYTISGKVHWDGEAAGDQGTIFANENVISVSAWSRVLSQPHVVYTP